MDAVLQEGSWAQGNAPGPADGLWGVQPTVEGPAVRQEADPRSMGAGQASGGGQVNYAAPQAPRQVFVKPQNAKLNIGHTAKMNRGNIEQEVLRGVHREFVAKGLSVPDILDFINRATVHFMIENDVLDHCVVTWEE